MRGKAKLMTPQLTFAEDIFIFRTTLRGAGLFIVKVIAIQVTVCYKYPTVCVHATAILRTMHTLPLILVTAVSLAVVQPIRSMALAVNCVLYSD